MPNPTGQPHPVTYTPETHPWRGLTFAGYPPATFRLDGKPYCPNSWIVTRAGGAQGFGVLNTKAQCEELVASYGATLSWVFPTDASAQAKRLIERLSSDPDPVKTLADVLSHRDALVCHEINQRENALAECARLRAQIADMRERQRRAAGMLVA